MSLFNFDIGADKILGSIGGLAKDLRSAITGEIDPEKKAELEAKLMDIELQSNKMQVEVNNTEAKHPSLFVAGWRPFIGWICGFGLLYHYIINRIIEWVVLFYKPDMVTPTFELGDLIVILGGLLGLGGLRSIEKTKGVNNKH